MGSENRNEASGSEALPEPKRVIALQDAITTLTGLPQFPVVHAAMSKATEGLIREMETAPLPRLQAIRWLDVWSRYHLRLVTDLASWDSFRIVLTQVIHPAASNALFGAPNVVPTSKQAIELLNELDGRVRYWLQKACLRLSRSSRPRGKRGARRRGFPPASEDHRIVVAEIRRFGDEWLQHLPEICRALDGRASKLAARGTQRAPSWDAVAEELKLGNSPLRERVRKYFHYRLKSERPAKRKL